MSLRVFWANIIGCVLLAVLMVGCQKSPTGAVTGGIINQALEPGPRDIVVNSSPLPSQPAAPPVPVWIPENVLPQPEPQAIVIPENKPAADPVQACVDKCISSCTSSASRACSQSTGTVCKQNCGAIIDPSACSTACSLRDARICEPKFIEFCTSKCDGRCH